LVLFRERDTPGVVRLRRRSVRITAIIHTGQFSDASAESALVDIMLKRRDKILRACLLAVNPVRPHFRRHTAGWKLVGLDRLPEGPATLVASRR